VKLRHDLSAPLTVLQQRMGISRQATVPEVVLAQLASTGVEVEIDEVKPAPGGNLSWRGRPVLLYIHDQTSAPAGEWSNYRYHIAECRTLESMRAQGRGERYRVTDRADGWFSVHLVHEPWVESHLLRMRVCKNCLSALDWDGYTDKNSKRAAIFQAFSLSDFFGTYADRLDGAPQLAPPTRAPSATGPLFSRTEDRLPAPAAVDATAQPTRAGGPAAPTTAPAQAQPSTDPPWSLIVEDDELRAALVYLYTYGSLGDAQLQQVVGGARRARRFAALLDDLGPKLPFRVEISVNEGVRSFIRR
jgi:hypothetical protein